VPCFSQKFNVTVEHIEEYNIMYVRPVTFKDEMAQLLDDMYQYYEEQGKLKCKNSFKVQFEIPFLINSRRFKFLLVISEFGTENTKESNLF
jgi:hypothetical protein